MRRRLHLCIRNRIVLASVEQAEQITRRKQTDRCLCDRLLAHQSVLHCTKDVQVRISAVEIAAVVDRKRR